MTQPEQQPIRIAGGDVLAEHQHLHEVIDRLRAVHGRGELQTRLREFREFAVRHFAGEEAVGGFYDAVREQAPRQAGPLEELRAEHAALLHDCDELLVDVGHCGDDGLDAVTSRLGQLAERMLAHESRENELLLDVMNTDLGAGD